MKILINEEIKKAHGQLSKYNVKFLEFAEKHPESFKRSNYSISSVIQHNWASTLQPWPVFFNDDTKNQMSQANLDLINLVKSIPKRIFANNPLKMAEYFGFPVQIMQYFLSGLNDKHISHLLGRGDFIFSPAGTKCIEFNITSGLGGWVDHLWQKEYLKNPIISKFLTENQLKIKNENTMIILFNHLIEASLEEFSPQYLLNELNLAIVIPDYSIDHTREKSAEDSYLNTLYQDILQHYGTHLNGKIVYCGFPHLTFNGENVTWQDVKIHTILDYSGGYVPIEMAIAFKNNKVIIFNGSSSGMTSNKLNLAILSENEDSDLFTDEEKITIKKYIPWTRKITNKEATYQGETINLERFILSNRERLVLKPAIGSGGDNVLVGAKTTENQWQETVKTAVTAGTNHWQNLKEKTGIGNFQKFAKDLMENAHRFNYWVVQEKLESFPYLFQSGENGCDVHDAVWGFLVFGSKYAGGFMRVLPKENSQGVINTSQGARKTPILQVEE